ncbi:MAG: NUDIX hydrolase [Candidatus Phosphoribacter baldrii]|jgi:phosphohistidine phosphatase SixA/ADP-ribose pyrophosphatase YjhB (NUDIX family)|nr:NUDIX hydrolase [Candidatus Phosphoribacter baldrii]MBK6954207.1 NUDIX hydrolase [Candidatus Phosphoribacter baldrii]HRC11769.1 NUDIX hydrolase [Dermatophilaceae bacterium]
MSIIHAAGTVPWRVNDGTLEVALVHRPRYDDWSWSKGKLEPAEAWPVAAYRETAEETGLEVRLGMPLPPTTYRVLDRDGIPATKRVRYWAAEVTGGHGQLEHEIDAVAWLDSVSAHARLDYSHDREQLRALVRAHQRGVLTTWPLVIVRHALALPRHSWKGPDWKRPLSPEGRAQVPRIADALAAYGVRTLVSSPSTRCVQTIAGYAKRHGLTPRLRQGLSEEGFAQRGPKRVIRAIDDLFASGEPAALCGHGPVLPTMLSALLPRLAPAEDQVVGAEATLTEAADLGIDKGELFIAQVSGSGPSARIVAAERITTQQ